MDSQVPANLNLLSVPGRMHAGIVALDFDLLSECGQLALTVAGRRFQVLRAVRDIALMGSDGRYMFTQARITIGLIIAEWLRMPAERYALHI
ncbi:MAG: hypothetical protein NT037_13280 [Hyphomicrobiales bacterium]|jgi:hypothetical protein|nr:hypothetical protein [Hyphomicrobiales bacterium]